jgi:hypothetical protein
MHTSTLRLATIAATFTIAVPFIADRAYAGGSTPLTYCGQAAHGRSHLVADLNCAGIANGIIVRARSARIDLNGFNITGDSATAHGILCLSRCRIVGPGTISGAGSGVNGPKRIRIEGVTLTGNDTGLYVVGSGKPTSRAVIRSSTVSDNITEGVRSLGSVKATDSTVAGNGMYGIAMGLGSQGSFFSSGGKIALKDSVVTGNGLTHPDCGSMLVCADLATDSVRPRVQGGSACDTSYEVASGMPGSNWGVCSLD